MPPDRTSEILKAFTDSTKDGRGNLETDISSLLEEYLTETGLRQLNEDESAARFPNFPEAAVILQHSGVIYGRKVDYLWLMVQNAVRSDEKSDPNPAEGAEEKNCRRTRKRAQPLDFKPIVPEEARNINMRDVGVPKPPAALPRAFMQFEPRVISDNDVRLKNYDGEPIGLLGDFRVNWNTDANFMLCDDMDFCGLDPPPNASADRQAAASAVSPSDSGHNSDCCSDVVEKGPASPDVPSDRSMAVATPAPETETQTVVVKQPKTPKTPKSNAVPKITVTKFDMTSPLTGTAERMDNRPSLFNLPSKIIRKIIERKKTQRKSLKRIIDDVYEDEEDNLDHQISICNCFTAAKKKSTVSWSRRDIYKRLKLSEFDYHEEEGFYEKEMGTSQNLVVLKDICTKLSLKTTILCKSSIEDEIDRVSMSTNRNCAEDDDIPENCYIGSQNNIFEPSIARRLAQADSVTPLSSTSEQSDIAKRVEAWHASIQEKLKIAENRRSFDIKEYSKEILSAFKNGKKKAKIKFSDILSQKPPEEVSRYFLTTLMLANKNNISLEQPKPLTCGDFEMKLLSSSIDDKIDEDYLL